MSDRIEAPWTIEQVVALNRWQMESPFHPFTCGRDRGDFDHRATAQLHGDRDTGVLRATPAGWVCPCFTCGYRQTWAHAFMAEPFEPDPWKATRDGLTFVTDPETGETGCVGPVKR